MLSYLLKRLVWVAILLFGIASLSFVMANVLPGDPARMLVGPQASPQDLDHVRALHGLDKSVAQQFPLYLGRLVHLDSNRNASHQNCAVIPPGIHIDLGYSFHYRRPVVDLLKAKMPRSIELAMAALVVQLLLGVTAGLVAAVRRGTWWDEATVGATLLGISAPTFIIGLILQYILAYKLRVLPYDGYGKTSAEHLQSIVLPAFTLGIFGSALVAKIVREELRTLLQKDFVRTARAKGASRFRSVVVHALRCALVPLATIALLDLGTLIGGAIVTEKLFRWPGVGQMAVEALQNRDGPLIVGTVLFASTAIVLTTLLLDAVTLGLDPRLRRLRN